MNHPAVVASLESISKRVDFISYDANKKEAVYVRYPERSELMLI